MSDDYGAGHWSSNKVWDRRKVPFIDKSDNNNNRKVRKGQETPYRDSFHYGEEEKQWLDAIRLYLTSIDENTNWENKSMLLRKVIKLAFVFCETMKWQKTLENPEKKDDKSND